MKKILMVDLDDTVFHFWRCIKKFHPEIDNVETEKRPDEVTKVMHENKRMFLELELLEGAKEAIEQLKEHFDIYFLSTPVWEIHESWGDKKVCLEKYFGDFAFKRLILTHRKDLAKGSFIIDDRKVNGVDEFEGIHIHFGSEQFPDWFTVTTYLLNNK